MPKYVTADFNYGAALRVHITGPGTGHVWSTPPGIECGETCKAMYGPGTGISLTAAAHDDSFFNGWSGACGGMDEECYLTIEGETDVYADFGTEGGMGGCDPALPCSAPSTGRVTLCGSLYDVEDRTALSESGATGEPCDGTGTSAGAASPCGVEIRFYDPQVMLTSPATAAPLELDEVYVDDLGRFCAGNVRRPSLGGRPQRSGQERIWHCWAGG